MNHSWLERIGVRLGLALVAVLLLLAVVTILLTNSAFERAAAAVESASAAELERRARSALLEVTEREAEMLFYSLDNSAAVSRSAARYLSRSLENPTTGEQLSLSRADSGHWLDPDPQRTTTLHVPPAAANSVTALRDARQSLSLDDYFESVAPELGDGIGIYFLSPEGVTRYYPPLDFTTFVEPDFDPTVQPIFRMGLPEVNPNGATVWTPPYVDDVGNGLLVTAVTPVYAAGEFRGVLNVDVSLSRLADRLSDLSPLPESFVLLLDDRASLITSSPGATRMLGYSEELQFGTPLSGASMDEALALMDEMGIGVTGVPVPGNPLVLAFAPLPGVAWRLAVGAPLSVVETPARELAAGIAQVNLLSRPRSIVATLLVILLALIVLVVATRTWVVRPIHQLVAATRRVSAGELGTTLSTGAKGEFRVLAEAFNRMSTSLAHRRQEILDHQHQLERQVAERTSELSNLLGITADLGSAPDVPSLLRSVLLRLREAVPFEGGSIWLLEEENLQLIASVDREGSSATVVTSAASIEGQMGRLRENRPVLLAAGKVLESTAEAARADLLLAPLTYRNRLSGVLALANPLLDAHHLVGLVAVVAQQLGTALENARLLLEARERSALEERQHLARELHDSVSQALFGVVLGLQTAQKELEGPSRLRTSVEYASELADAALKEMRALIFELRPEALEAEGLVGLLGRQAEALRARHEIEVDLAVAEPALSLEAKAVLYRVAQEALHNVVKHARAGRIQVSLTGADRFVRLEVRDDGRGFASGERKSESFGLHSMSERMALLGGTLEVQSEPGKGTTVTASLPASTATSPRAPAALAVD